MMDIYKNSFTIKKSHPALAGHFINDPVVPGVIILEHVIMQWSAHGAKKITSFDYSKFLNPLRPDTSCQVSFIETKSPLKKEFIVLTYDNLPICKGRFVHV